jgi:hypothetical protein
MNFPAHDSKETAVQSTSDWKTLLYERLAEDDEGRVCNDISEDACRESPGNFLATLVANTFSNVADRLASAKTTLPWLMLQLGAPAWLISLLVPIRESGSMLPQMLIGAFVRRKPVRKWVWVAGGAAQGFALLLIVWCAFRLQGLTAGIAITGLLVVFSLARGACSVAYKDVLGKTIPKTRRGRLSGWISAIAGLAAFLTGMWLSTVDDSETVSFYTALLFVAALLWFLAIVAYSRIIEFPGVGALGGSFQPAGIWYRHGTGFGYFAGGGAVVTVWCLRHRIRLVLSTGVFCTGSVPRRGKAGAQDLYGGHGRWQQAHGLCGGE